LNITHDQIQCVTEFFDPVQTLGAILSFNNLELFSFQDGFHISPNGRFVINDQGNSWWHCYSRAIRLLTPLVKAHFHWSQQRLAFVKLLI